MMEVRRIHPNLIGSRIDPHYYRDEFIKLEERKEKIGTAKFKHLAEVTSWVRKGVFDMPASFYQASGVPFVRISDFDGWFLNVNGCICIPPEKHREEYATALTGGDLIMSKVGTIGAIVRVPADAEVNISQNVIGIKSHRNLDSAYLLAYLNSGFGTALLEREVTTVVQGKLTLDVVRSLPILEVHTNVQLYIGEKVRQAEQLRRKSGEIVQRVQEFNQRLIPPQTALNFDQRVRRVPVRLLTERMDAHFYPAVVEKYLQGVNCPTPELRSLCKAVFNGQTEAERSGGGSVTQATVANLTSTFLKGPYRHVEPLNDASKLLNGHDLLICNAAHNKSYIGTDITYSQAEGTVFPSTEVMVIRVDRQQVPASYVRAYLQTRIGYLQIQSTIRGITAHSYPSDVKLLKIPVPVVPAGEREGWFSLDEQLLLAGKYADVAAELIASAKLLVEALIEGKVTEAELREAQEGLERGDTTADRELLSRLTTKGVDVAGEPPLFPDLDALYETLEQASEVVVA